MLDALGFNSVSRPENPVSRPGFSAYRLVVADADGCAL